MTKIEQVLRFGNMPNPSEEALSIIERVKKIVLASPVVRFRMSTLQIERIKFAETISIYGAESAFSYYQELVKVASRNGFGEEFIGPGLSRIDALLCSGFPRGSDPISSISDPSVFSFKTVLSKAILHDLLWSNVFDDMVIGLPFGDIPPTIWGDKRKSSCT